MKSIQFVALLVTFVFCVQTAFILKNGERDKAIADFRAAIAAKPDYHSPRKALEDLGLQP